MTKNKEQMMFITGSDELSKIDIVIFPRIYKNIKSVNIGDIVSIKGKVNSIVYDNDSKKDNESFLTKLFK